MTDRAAARYRSVPLLPSSRTPQRRFVIDTKEVSNRSDMRERTSRLERNLHPREAGIPRLAGAEAVAVEPDCSPEHPRRPA
jgi:hypothetical protein